MVFSELLAHVCPPWPSFSGNSDALSHLEMPVPFWVHIEVLVPFPVQWPWSQLGRPDSEPGEGGRTYLGIKVGSTGRRGLSVARSINQKPV